MLFNWKDLLHCWDLDCTASSSFISAVLRLHLCQLLLVLFNCKDPLHCWDLGCIVSSSFISAVLCLHPSYRLYCVFILHLSCTVSSSMPTIAGALQLEGSTALLGSWLYCVFISTTSCWCSLIGMILPTGLFGISTGAHCGLRQVLLHDFIVYLLVHMVHVVA